MIAYRATLDVPRELAQFVAKLLLAGAAADLPTLADLGYDGTGIPARQPTSARELDIDTRTRNAIQRSLRCLGEHGFALHTGRWRALQHVTASPGKIGGIARACGEPRPTRRSRSIPRPRLPGG